jgi:GPCR proteolysis site, GPS, motif
MVDINFHKNSSGNNPVCISQKAREWTNADCITTQRDKDTVDCGCDELTFYSVIDDAEGLFKDK